MARSSAQVRALPLLLEGAASATMPSRQSDAASGSGRGELGWRGSKQPERSSSLPKPHRPSSAKKGYLSREYIRCTSDKPSLAASERNRSKAESAILDKLLVRKLSGKPPPPGRGARRQSDTVARRKCRRAAESWRPQATNNNPTPPPRRASHTDEPLVTSDTVLPKLDRAYCSDRGLTLPSPVPRQPSTARTECPFDDLSTRSVSNSVESILPRRETGLARRPSERVREKISHMFAPKAAHYIGDTHASFELNKMTGGANTFGSTWVRPVQLKRYYGVYKDMNVDKHGRVSREQFSNYLREKNPQLAQHSKKLFSEMMKRSNQEGQDTMDFVSVLKMLYPQATDCDIAALREMSSSYGLPKKRELLKKLDDASVLYKMLNTPGDNALTPEQMEDGLLGLGQEYHEVWNQVAQLFGPTSDGTQQSVDFMTFFQWYSDVELPATPQ